MKKPVNIDFERMFTLAQQNKEVESLENNLFKLYQLQSKSYELRRMLQNEKMPDADKVKAICNFPGFMPSSLFEELLALTLKHNMADRIYYLDEGFHKILDVKLNRVTIQIMSAVELSDSILNEIKLKLEKMLTKTVVLRPSIDPNLLAGILLKLPDGKIFDFSYNRLLDNLKYFVMERN